MDPKIRILTKYLTDLEQWYLQAVDGSITVSFPDVHQEKEKKFRSKLRRSFDDDCESVPEPRRRQRLNYCVFTQTVPEPRNKKLDH